MNKNPIIINRSCECVRTQARHRQFVKRKFYFVKFLYQLPDGEMLVEVINDYNETVQAKANRFNMFCR